MAQTNKLEAERAAIAEFAAELAASTNDLEAALAAPRGHTDAGTANLDLVMDLPVTLKVVLGSATMPVATLTGLQRGALVKLDRKLGEPVEILANGRVVARGELVVLDEEGSRFGVSLTEIGGSPALRR
jgi:flagellar motor switch protein FliN/FliY